MSVTEAKEALFPHYVNMARVCIDKQWVRGATHACPLCCEGLGEVQKRLGRREYRKIAAALGWPETEVLTDSVSPCHKSRQLKGLQGVEAHMAHHAKPQGIEEEERDDRGCHRLYQEAFRFARGVLPRHWRHHLVLIFSRREIQLPSDVVEKIFKMTKAQQ